MCKDPEAPGTTVVRLEVKEQEDDVGLNKAEKVSMKRAVQCCVSCARGFGLCSRAVEAIEDC